MTSPAFAASSFAARSANGTFQGGGVKFDIVAVGWDVGGWHGTGNAVVVLGWDGTRVHRLGVGQGPLPAGGAGLGDFVEAFCGTGAHDALRARARVVVGVDAPLGYPRAFRAFVADPAASGVPVNPAAPFVDNPLAFRVTDRAIAERFPRKAPLSASFDKLGNPATVAMRHTWRWTNGRGPLVDLGDRPNPDTPAVIEVYPALSKVEPRRAAEATARYQPLLDGLMAGTDRYDAALSAILALGWAAGDDVLVPRMGVTPSAPGEGAIWYPTHAEWRLPGTP